MSIDIPDVPFEAFEKTTRANKAFKCVISEKLDAPHGEWAELVA